MQIVINVDNELYKYFSKRKSMHDDGYFSHVGKLIKALRDGTPLPKGHGDLKDVLDLDLFVPSLGTNEYVNDLMARHNIDYVNGDDEDKVRAFALDLIHSCMNVIETGQTIIEADKVL